LPLAGREVGTRPPSGKLDTYFLYLEGRVLQNRRTPEAVARALKNFEAAVAQDPEFAQAHSGIADCLLVMTRNFEDLAWAESGPRAKAAARKAIARDDTLAEAHASLGLVLQQDYEWATAERELRRAVELQPGLAPAHLWPMLLLGNLNRHEEAEEELLTAARFDLLSPALLLNRGGYLAYRGEVDAAFRT
jgi:tetratricopeptide (TPR) repeat protein